MALKIYFGSLAFDYIVGSGRLVADVAESIGNTPANQFSKWKAGKWTYIADRKLVRVIDAVAGKDRTKRTALMIGYLIDMTPEPFRPLLNIVPRTGESDDEEQLLSQKWSPSLRRKLEAIAAAYARDDDFRRMADQLGEWAKAINARAEKPAS
jgi:hypothetical protein